MTDDELDRLQALADEATNGPWHEVDPDNDTLFWIQTEPGIRVAKVWQWDDGMFIAATRDAIPALIAEVRRLRAENAELRDEVTENDELRPMVSDSLSELVGELQGRLDTIRDLANARLADKENMASIQEAETLWAIVAATEGA